MYSISKTPSEYLRRRFLTDEEKMFFDGIISSAPSSIYGCFTFKSKVDEQQAKTSFDSFISILSSRWRLRENVAWIRAMETKTLSGCSDYSIHLHFHFVLLSNAKLNPVAVQERWNAMVGNSKCELYDCKQDGLGYLLKMLGTDCCEFDISDNIWLFQPERKPRNKHERRMLKRSIERNSKRRQHSTSGHPNFDGGIH